MPAPVPVRIDHGNPLLLTSLAAEAGSAQARRRTQERLYQMELQQMAQDSAFLRDSLSRRRGTGHMRQTSPTMLADASGYRPRAQTFRNDRPQNQLQRLAMQSQQHHGGVGFMAERAGGVDPARSAQQSPVQMVPAAGPYKGQYEHPPSTIQEHGTGQTFTRFNDGITTITGAGAGPDEAQMLREMDPRFAASQQPMVAPEVRQQLDVVRAMEGVLPDAQYNALLQAAESGQMDMAKLMDDARQAIPSHVSARQTASEKQADRAQADVQVFQALRAMPEDNQIAYAESQRWFEPEVPGAREGYDPEALASMQQRNREGAKRAIRAREVIADQLAEAYDGGLPMTGSTSQQSGPQIGDIVDGMKFLGGDPANPASWGVR